MPDERRRIHVLTLLDYLTFTGGAERLALEIATRLDPERFRSTMCASRFVAGKVPDANEQRALDQIEEARIDFLPLGRRRRGEALPWRHLAAYVRREHVDVLHAHMFGSNLWGTVIGRLARVPVVVSHEHTWSFEGRPLRRLLDREVIARFSDAFVAVSREDQRKMIEIERIWPEKTRFLPNGIAATAPTPGRDVRTELGIAPDAPVVGSVGLLRPQKAFEVLIQAADLLRKDHPGLWLIVAGDGPEDRRLQALIDELGLNDTVMMLGRRLDVPDLLMAFDVAALSSDFEGSPLAVMEYMEAGCPIVATSVGGVPDLIDDGVHGLLVPPRDPTRLAVAIDALLRHPERAKAMGERARERRRAEFDLDTMVHKVEALYEELLVPRHSHPRQPAARQSGVADAVHVAPTALSQRLIEDWDALADRVAVAPFLRPGWMFAWTRAFAHGKLFALTARRGGELVGVLPFVAHRGVLSAPANWHTPVFGFLAADDEVGAALAADFVSRARVRADLPFLDSADRHLTDCRRAAEHAGRSVVVRGGMHSPYVALEDSSWEAYRASLDRKARRDVERRRRRLEEQGHVSFEFSDGREGLDRLLGEGFAVEGSGWKEGRGSAIASSSDTHGFYSDVAHWACDRGWLLLAFLRLDGKPIAFDLCLQTEGVIYVLKGGFDPAFRRFAPGLTLTYESLRRAFEIGISAYELLGADEPYKLVWTKMMRERIRFQAFSRSPRGRASHLAWTYGRRAARSMLAAGRHTDLPWVRWHSES